MAVTGRFCFRVVLDARRMEACENHYFGDPHQAEEQTARERAQKEEVSRELSMLPSAEGVGTLSDGCMPRILAPIEACNLRLLRQRRKRAHIVIARRATVTQRRSNCDAMRPALAARASGPPPCADGRDD